ncbi:hypothetical protein IF1G_10974 [Cordyceps javanica]|uniref:Secreted protein n=1 Tax=Cordyceps javanica TaxID=43265 RepID=A0A545ULJ5_9HYPO|nr:hypothetical protein IF1G_10974 [Cordyceps javanica]
MIIFALLAYVYTLECLALVDVSDFIRGAIRVDLDRREMVDRACVRVKICIDIMALWQLTHDVVALPHRGAAAPPKQEGH